MEKLLEAEKIEEESRLLNRALIAMRKEEEEKVKEHKEHQKMVREELHQANLDLERYKLVQKEEQRIADLRVSWNIELTLSSHSNINSRYKNSCVKKPRGRKRESKNWR